jgi:hypothetical protein
MRRDESNHQRFHIEQSVKPFISTQVAHTRRVTFLRVTRPVAAPARHAHVLGRPPPATRRWRRTSRTGEGSLLEESVSTLWARCIERWSDEALATLQDWAAAVRYLDLQFVDEMGRTRVERRM